MAINLRADFRTPLIEKLTEILSRVDIRNNSFLDHDPFYELSDLDEKLEKKNTWKTIDDFIGDSPLTDFFFEVLSEEIQKTRKYDSKIEPFHLTKIEEYRDPSSLADRLLKDFESLPREFKLFIELPIYEFKEILRTDRFELSNSLSLVCPNQEFELAFPPPVYQPRIRRLSFIFPAPETEPKLSWNDYYIYCEITVQGFIGIYEDTSPIKRASFLLRAFCGLSLALQLFEIGYAFNVEDTYIKVYEKSGDGWNAKKPRLLPTELVQGLEKFNPHEEYKAIRLINKRPKQVLSILKGLFSNEQENERLLRAAQWYFDSYCGDNELLSFVKSTICLEMLLGEKKVSDLIGIMELLRNRCAYFIGSNHSEREEILKDFNEIYSTRSQIVHSGKNRLTKLERRSLYKLRRLCARVIRKEISLSMN